MLDTFGGILSNSSREEVTAASSNLALLAFKNEQSESITIFSSILTNNASQNSTHISLTKMQGQLNIAQQFQKDASMFIPSSVFSSKRTRYVHSFLFNDDKLFHTDLPNEISVCSKILSVTVGNQRIYDLPENIKIRFRKTNKLCGHSDKQFCGFWDESKGKYSETYL